jgi:hypothetical protein
MDTPLVLFGAFDRHNLGDLLFPHIAQTLLGDAPVRFAGLAARDLRPFGGHRVEAIGDLIAAWRDAPARLLHVGGETLTCGAWPAAVMLLDASEVQATVSRLESNPAQQAAWLRGRLGRATPSPYVISRCDWPALRWVGHAGVGGVDLDRVDAVLRDAVLARLREADAITVRDRRTRARLLGAGLGAALMPDTAVLVAELFGERIAQHGEAGEPGSIRRAFPQGYVALQCSAVFADDATLATLAAQLAQAQAASGLGIALFRAGAAPWHDQLGVLQRLAQRLPAAAVRVFASLDIWDLCALIAGSAVTASSSLHGRIVATAFARPHLSLQPADAAQRIDKADAWVETWEPDAGLSVTVPAGLAAGLDGALRTEPATLRALADRLARHCRAGCAVLHDGLRG